jgi:DNA-directed RNA polymerase specialized sigma24 family protein
VASGYDEWVAARTPSLLRFALALAGHEETADGMVRASLARVRSSWESILRTDDPDLRARRFVVDACPSRRAARQTAKVLVPVGGPDHGTRADGIPPWLDALPPRRRAAVVLRHLEDRTDAELAEILRASTSAVRKDLDRALASLPVEVPTSPDARDPLLRAALAGLAAPAPAQLSAPVGSADTPPGRRPRSHWLAAGAVIALVTTIAVVNHATRTEPGVIKYPSVTVPAVWRTESYDGVQVRVPDTWGWGGAPIRSDVFGGRRLGACGANQAAVRSPSDHSSYLTSATPFSGRPAMLSYRCYSWGSDGVLPSTDAVWFDSPMEVGLKALGAVTAETRGVGTQHVTVFSADSTLRREILGTAQEVGVDANGCPTQAVQRPSAGAPGLVPSSLSVCVYSQDTGSSVLLWSTRRDGASSLSYLRAFAAAAGRGGAATCPVTPQGEWVALGLRDSQGGAERWDVLDLGCARLVGQGTEAPLTDADVGSWAGDGTAAYVTTPRGADERVASYFRKRLPG